MSKFTFVSMLQWEVSPFTDVLDSRDILKRIEELADREGDEDDPLEAEERDELQALRDLAEEGEQYAGDWQDGATLVRESYFKRYAEELAEDMGFAAPDSWPGRHIDWAAAAEELKQDYSEVDFAGVTYLVRS